MEPSTALICLITYFIIGIGYTKTVNALSKDTDFGCSALSTLAWPICLIIASFWNFKND